MPMQDGQGAPEVSPRTPAGGDPDERKALFFKTQDPMKLKRYEKHMVNIWKRHIEDWAIPRRMKLRDVLRAIEYNKGNQYISWDPFSFAYYNPFAVGSLPGQTEGSQQGTDEANIYQATANIIQWLRRVWTSYLGGAVPRVEWWPGDSESDLDNRCAQARGRAYRKIAGDNMDKGFLALCLDYLFLTGSYFTYTKWSMDKSITGTHFEPIMGWQDQEILPNRYICPNCGTKTPANLDSIDRRPPCPTCGRPLSSADFYPAQKIKMPVQTGQREVPNGQVRWDVWNILNMEGMPQASPQGGGVIGNSPLWDLSCLVTKGALRRMYPGAWEKLRNADQDTSGTDTEITRIAQIRALTPGTQRGVVVAPNQLSYHRVWFNPDAIYGLEDASKGEIQEMADLIRDGCMAVIQEDTILDIREAQATKELTWCGAEQDAGAYPPAPVMPALDFQDRINDRGNSIDEFHDRCGNPPILYDAYVFGDALNGKFLPAGSLLGTAANRDIGRKLSDGLWQPEFHMDNGIYNWLQELLQMVQLLVGVNPQSYGGSDKNIKTAAGQQQALSTSRAAQGGYYQSVTTEWAVRANLSVDCFANNATKDDYLITKSDDSADFLKEPIRLVDLRANAVARPEANQDYPIDYDQQRELYRELIGMASGREPNPLVMEILDTFENRRQAMLYLGPPDMELPEQVARDKVLKDITTIMTTDQPIVPGQDPATMQPVEKPVVEPDYDIDRDYLIPVTIPTVVRYALKNYQMRQQKPQNWQALILYLQIARQYVKEVEAESILTQGAPGWQGVLGQPAKPGGDQGAGPSGTPPAAAAPQTGAGQ